VKDQYVGDINDFEKYAALRSLATASGLPLVVCWMLTAADDSGEGANTGYLHDTARYRHLDPHVFDRLAQIVAADERSVAAVERHGVLDEATFVGRRLEDHLASRVAFFRELWSAVRDPSLVFFDPDIGLAGKSVRKGGKRSSMYLFPEEAADASRRGHSLVIYQHFPRQQREPYLQRAFDELGQAHWQDFALRAVERAGRAVRHRSTRRCRTSRRGRAAPSRPLDAASAVRPRLNSARGGVGARIPLGRPR
jgi:hypothetical protein